MAKSVSSATSGELKTEPKHIGIFGGAFDPIHNGHLAVAAAAVEQLQLQALYFVPTFVPAHKPQPWFSFDARVAMLKDCIAHEPRYCVSTVERNLPQPSYTINTLKILRSQLKQPTEFTLIVGEDSYWALPSWNEWQTLQTLCKIAVFPRKTDLHDQIPSGRHHTQAYWLKAALISVSSTNIRAQLHQGRSIEHLVPKPVQQWILGRHTNTGDFS